MLGCGVTDDMLVGSREFSDVFPDFLSWINQCIKETKRAATTPFFPGAVFYYAYFVLLNLCLMQF